MQENRVARAWAVVAVRSKHRKQQLRPTRSSTTYHHPHRCSLPLMKIYSLSIILAPPAKACTTLSTASDLSSFPFYQRGSVAEFVAFFSKTIAERTPQGQRQSVQENAYTAHVYNRGGAEQLAGQSVFGVRATSIRGSDVTLPLQRCSSATTNTPSDRHFHS